jgi:hypothetical protein
VRGKAILLVSGPLGIPMGLSLRAAKVRSVT